MKRFGFVLGFALSVATSVVTSAASAQTVSTLEQVRERGFVVCGVTDRMPGFATQHEDGTWSGFNVAFCKGLAAAVLGDAQAYRAMDYWLDALVARDVDVLHAGSTWTFERDTNQGVDFPATYFYDGQGIIAHAGLGVTNLREAAKSNEVKVCAISPTSTALSNLQDYMAKNPVSWQIVNVQTLDGMWRAFFGGRCNMAIHDRTALAGVHAGRLQDSADYVVFSEVISKEPLAPAVRQGDPVWRDLVGWVTYVTVAAEEFGITQANVDDMKATSKVPQIRRLLGADPGLGEGFGLDDEWAYRVIKQVGNYGEIFERNLGQGSPLKLARGLNALWTEGGLMYAPPVR